MERKIGDKNILDKFAEEFCTIVDRYSEYMIVSGFAAISSGRTRGTEDIDIIINNMSEKKFIEMHNDLVKNNFECMQSEYPRVIFEKYLIRGDSVRYKWKNKHLPEMEFHFVKDRIDEYQLRKRIKMELTGLDIYFAPIEGNIAFKEEWLKGEKDFEDAKHLRIVYSDLINEKEINKIKKMIRDIRYEK